jgi:two-component system, OmpR family, alkaline phosphatase synthesis response regulator PhoP
MKLKILLVEDDESLRQTTRDLLSSGGYSVVACGTAEESLNLIQRNPPDLLISDVGLPGMSGIRLCEILKADQRTATIPIILLTMLSSETHKIRGLQQGADDYVTKPFSFKELLARIEALMRRVQHGGALFKRLEFKDLTLDLDRHEARLKGHLLPLRRKEFDLLALFLKNRGKLLTKAFITEAIWKDEVIVMTNTINAHIRNLRAHLGPARNYIETVIGEGYRLKDD